MSATPGAIEACQDCPYKDTVCDSDCEIYQDLIAEFKNEMEANK